MDTALANLKLFMFARHHGHDHVHRRAHAGAAPAVRHARPHRARHRAGHGSRGVAVAPPRKAPPPQRLRLHRRRRQGDATPLPHHRRLRAAAPGLVLVGSAGGDRDGGGGGRQQLFPAQNCVLDDMVRRSQRDPAVWGLRAAEFIPERWLGGRDGGGETDDDDDSDDGLSLPTGKGEWRPFAWGPQNCIGQGLAMVELKLVLAVMARAVDVECAWEEWDWVK